MGTNVSLFNWLTTLRGFLSPYPSKIFLSHKGNGETDFLMRGQLSILTYAFTLLTQSYTHSIVHSFNHQFTRTFIKLMMMMSRISLIRMVISMSMMRMILVQLMSMMSGVRQLKCVNLSVYNNLSICVCIKVCRMYRILIKSSSDLE